MNTIKQQEFGWGYLFIGILFIIVAIVAFCDPWANLIALATLFGITALITGIGLIMTRLGSRTRLLVGILQIVLGLFFLANLGLTASVIPFLFAAWFIANSVSNLFLLPYLKRFGKGTWWFTLILNGLGILLGVLLLFEPVLSALTLSFMVGFYFMLVGISHIMLAFYRPTIHIEIENDSVDRLP